MVIARKHEWMLRVQVVEEAPDKAATEGIPRKQLRELRAQVLSNLAGAPPANETPMLAKWKPPEQPPKAKPLPYPPEKRQWLQE